MSNLSILTQLGAVQLEPAPLHHAILILTGGQAHLAHSFRVREINSRLPQMHTEIVKHALWHEGKSGCLRRDLTWGDSDGEASS